MVSPVRGYHRRYQAETPLIDLFKFASPALIMRKRGVWFPEECIKMNLTKTGHCQNRKRPLRVETGSTIRRRLKEAAN
jgi:hypothetical protein